MNTALYTGYDKAYEPLAELTVPRMRLYAKRHNYAFLDFTLPPPPPMDIYWTGVWRGLHLLKNVGFQRVVYLDVDQVITNPGFDLDRQLTNFKHGFHVPRDWGDDSKENADCSACCLIMHQDCIPILEEIISEEPNYRGLPFPEQAPMREVLRRQTIGQCGPVYYWDRKPFNCVPDQVCPGKVPEPWKPGDWCAHLTMLPLEQRIALFHEITK